MGKMLFDTSRPSKTSSRAATNAAVKRVQSQVKGKARAKSKPANEQGRRRFEFVIVSLPVDADDIAALRRSERAMDKQIRTALTMDRGVYDDFASSPQKPGRAVFMLAKQGGKAQPPQLMRVSRMNQGRLEWLTSKDLEN